MDDIVRQFKGVSDGLMRKVVGSSPTGEASSSISNRNLSWHSDEISKHVIRQSTSETVNSFSDNDEGDKDGSYDRQEVTSVAQGTGWHSDNELNSKGFPPRVMKRREETRHLGAEKKVSLAAKSEGSGLHGLPAASSSPVPRHLEDPIGMPPEVASI